MDVKSDAKGSDNDDKSPSSVRERHVQAAWSVILKRVNDDPDEWDNSVKRLFDRIDANGSGDVTVSELGETIHLLGISMSEDEVMVLFDQIDLNLNGKITLKEFFAAIEDRKAAVSKKKVTNRSQIDRAWNEIMRHVESDEEEWKMSVDRMFNVMDEDRSGCLDAHELCTKLRELGVTLDDEEAVLFTDEFDLDLDNKISYYEFAASIDKRRPMASAKEVSNEEKSQSK